MIAALNADFSTRMEGARTNITNNAPHIFFDAGTITPVSIRSDTEPEVGATQSLFKQAEFDTVMASSGETNIGVACHSVCCT